MWGASVVVGHAGRLCGALQCTYIIESQRCGATAPTSLCPIEVNWHQTYKCNAMHLQRWIAVWRGNGPTIGVPY